VAIVSPLAFSFGGCLNSIANKIGSPFTVIAAAVALAGCATSASEIAPAYVSPLQYQSYSCQQLAAEAARVSGRAAEVAGVQDAKRIDDQIATGAGVVVFWPALFFIKGDGQSAAELARLRGEYEALQKAATEKSCQVQVRKS
jgi:hypothetical protein